MKIKNIHKEGNKVYFTVIERNYYGEVMETDYMTNKSGNGLFIADDYYKQITGTCQFSLHQKTYSGVYKAIKKWFEDKEI